MWPWGSGWVRQCFVYTQWPNSCELAVHACVHVSERWRSKLCLSWHFDFAHTHTHTSVSHTQNLLGQAFEVYLATHFFICLRKWWLPRSINEMTVALPCLYSNSDHLSQTNVNSVMTEQMRFWCVPFPQVYGETGFNTTLLQIAKDCLWGKRFHSGTPLNKQRGPDHHQH